MLFLGRELGLLLDNDERLFEKEEFINNDAYMFNLNKQLDELYKKAKENLKQSTEDRKDKNDIKATKNDVKIGDRVWLENSTAFRKCMTGPYIVRKLKFRSALIEEIDTNFPQTKWVATRKLKIVPERFQYLK